MRDLVCVGVVVVAFFLMLANAQAQCVNGQCRAPVRRAAYAVAAVPVRVVQSVRHRSAGCGGLSVHRLREVRRSRGCW